MTQLNNEDLLLDLYKIHAYIPNDADGNPLTPFGNFCAGYEAAKAYSEREIADLRAENKQIDAINASLQPLCEGINCPACGSMAVTPKEVWYTKQIKNLQAHINVLREALEKIVGHDMACSVIAKQALASTPAQSLQAHDDEVIELVAQDISRIMVNQDWVTWVVDEIRALKGKP